jgi:hypothetical protein
MLWGEGWGWLFAQEVTEEPAMAMAAPAAVCRNCRRLGLGSLRADNIGSNSLKFNAIVLLRPGGHRVLAQKPSPSKLVGPLYHHIKTDVKQFPLKTRRGREFQEFMAAKRLEEEVALWYGGRTKRALTYNLRA